MRRADLRLVVVFLGLMGTASAQADEKQSYQWQGATRTAILHTPEHLGGHPAPLVIALYGSDDNAEGFQKAIRWDRVADRENFIVAYPEAIDGRWNYGRANQPKVPLIHGHPADDIGFLRIMIDDLVAKHVVDQNRIYATGFSRGALMSFTLACALPDKIAAIATISSPMSEDQIEDCKPGHPKPVMMINGTADGSLPYGGSTWRNTRFLPVPDTLEYWARTNGCAGQDDGQTLPHLNKNDLTHAILFNWKGCQAGTAVRFYKIENGGHSWPRLVDPNDPEPTHGMPSGGRNGDFETPLEAWNFFKQYQLRQ